MLESGSVLAVALGVAVSTLRAAAPLLLAGTGELVTERSGVLNLGVEGTMLVGAACGFIGTAATGQPAVGVLCGGFPADDLRRAGCVALYDGPADMLARYAGSPLDR